MSVINLKIKIKKFLTIEKNLLNQKNNNSNTNLKLHNSKINCNKPNKRIKFLKKNRKNLTKSNTLFIATLISTIEKLMILMNPSSNTHKSIDQEFTKIKV